MSAPITGITITAETLFALTDGCQAALDADICDDKLSNRLARASAELAARKFNRGSVIAFTRKQDGDR